MYSVRKNCFGNLLQAIGTTCFILFIFSWTHTKKTSDVVQSAAPSRRSLPLSDPPQLTYPPIPSLQFQSKRLDLFLNHMYINETMWNNPDPTYEELQTWWDYHARPDIPGIWTVRPPSDGGLEVFLWGTKFAQRRLFEFQNPVDCTGQKFLIWGGWPSGIGSVINVLS